MWCLRRVLQHAVWETCLDVEYSLCIVELTPEAHVSCIDVVVVKPTERQMEQDEYYKRYCLLLV